MKTIYSILFSVMFCALATTCPAQSQGPNSPTVAIAAGPGASFPNLTGLYANDNNAAYSDLAAHPNCISAFMCYHSQEVAINGFGFSIPANAMITGVKAEISKKVSQPITTIHDSIVQLIIGGTPTGLNLKATNQWQMTFTYESYGDSTNLWGTGLTPANVNSAMFGLRLMLSNGDIDQTAQVDHVRLTVYYDITSGIYAPTPAEGWSATASAGLLNVSGAEYLNGEKLQLFNVNGQLIHTWEHRNTAINVQAFPQGIYFVRSAARTGLPAIKVLLTAE